MTVLFPILILIASVLSIPAYLLSRRHSEETRWLLFLCVPSTVAWFFLTYFGYGAQSLSNIIEVLWLIGAAILLCYIKVLVIDRFIKKPKATTYVFMIFLVLGALLLRSFMPVLPE